MTDQAFDIAPDDETTVEAHMVLAQIPLGASLPSAFPLVQLLQFVPDIRLKRHADVIAVAALAVNVTGADGIAAADAKIADLRTAIDDIEKGFAFPCSASNELHKRMTGMRGDFTQNAKDALSVVAKRTYVETARLATIAEEERIRAQEEADQRVRDELKAAAATAKKSGAPTAIVRELQQRAKVEVAPAVTTSTPAPTMTSSTAVERHKARVKGTKPGDEPNPDVSDMTPAQQEQARRLCAAIGQGLESLACISLNWGYLNNRANKEVTTFNVTGLEIYKEGGLRAKPKKKG